jgi:hypothetical protein
MRFWRNYKRVLRSVPHVAFRPRRTCPCYSGHKLLTQVASLKHIFSPGGLLYIAHSNTNKNTYVYFELFLHLAVLSPHKGDPAAVLHFPWSGKGISGERDLGGPKSQIQRKFDHKYPRLIYQHPGFGYYFSYYFEYPCALTVARRPPRHQTFTQGKFALARLSYLHKLKITKGFSPVPALSSTSSTLSHGDTPPPAHLLHISVRRSSPTYYILMLTGPLLCMNVLGLRGRTKGELGGKDEGVCARDLPVGDYHPFEGLIVAFCFTPVRAWGVLCVTISESGSYCSVIRGRSCYCSNFSRSALLSGARSSRCAATQKWPRISERCGIAGEW